MTRRFLFATLLLLLALPGKAQDYWDSQRIISWLDVAYQRKSYENFFAYCDSLDERYPNLHRDILIYRIAYCYDAGEITKLVPLIEEFEKIPRKASFAQPSIKEIIKQVRPVIPEVHASSFYFEMQEYQECLKSLYIIQERCPYFFEPYYSIVECLDSMRLND